METREGLPNSCSACGELQTVSWFAESEDAARSGVGLCASCAGQKQTFEAVAQPNAEVDRLARDVIAVVRDAQGVSNERVLPTERAARAESEAPAHRDRAHLPAEDRQAPDRLGKKR